MLPPPCMSTLAFGEWPLSMPAAENFGDGGAFGSSFPVSSAAATSGWEAAWPSSSAALTASPAAASGFPSDSFGANDGTFGKAEASDAEVAWPTTSAFAADAFFQPSSSGAKAEDSGFGLVSQCREGAEAAQSSPSAAAFYPSAGSNAANNGGFGLVRSLPPSDVLDVSAKAPVLRHRASELSEELNRLRIEAGQQALAAKRCVAALHARAEELAVEFTEAQSAGPISADAARHRQAILREEVRALERRAEASNPGSSYTPAWASVEAEKIEVLESRICKAQAREAEVSKLGNEQLRHGEERLAELREQRHELQSHANARSGSMTWQARFEAFVAAQTALADRAAMLGPDPGAARLDQALSAASAAAGAAAGSHAPGARGSPPEYLVAAVRCICGLAEAERRRGGLLVDRWRDLQGNTPWQAPEGAASIPPVDRVFSPSQPFEWDLDLCRAASPSEKRL